MRLLGRQLSLTSRKHNINIEKAQQPDSEKREAPFRPARRRCFSLYSCASPMAGTKVPARPGWLLEKNAQRLGILYVKRRQNINDPGIGDSELESTGRALP